MEDLKLEIDEGIILQTTDVERYQKNDNYIEVYELYLTNKNLISVYEKSNGMFKKTENVVEKIPLTDIKVVNGKVQVFKKDDNDYGLGLQILFTNGTREHFVFCKSKKEVQIWLENIIETITGEKPSVKENNKEVNKVGVATAGLMAGFKKIVDSEKDIVDDIKTQVGNEELKEIDEGFEEEIDENIEEVVEQEEKKVEITKKETKMKKENNSYKFIYCSNCGEKLNANSKFCNSCGSSTDSNIKNSVKEEIKIEEQTERKVIYDGKIHKCPNCGEVLKSFSVNCPACGYELRNTNASSAIKEFSLKLEKIESNREYEKHRDLFSMAEGLQTISKTDEQKISLIKSFPIPNSKEDMLEFMILATSSMNMSVYDSANTDISKSEKEVNTAWFAKVQQVYEKARRIYSTDDIFGEIKELYEKCRRDIEKSKKKGILKWVLKVGWISLLWIIMIIMIIVGAMISGPKNEAKEITRLENIVVEVQEALEKEEYKHALRIADSIDYQRYDKEDERKWDLERKYWVEKVIDKAAEKGITLEYTYTEDIDNANYDSDKDTNSGGFIDGFNEGLHSNDEEIQDNIDQFKENLNGGNSNDSKDEKETSSTTFSDNIIANSNEYIKIKDVAYTMTEKYMTCIVTITNSDSKKAIQHPSFRVTAYDKDGKILGSEERVLNVLYPNQSMVDQGTLIEVSEKPFKVEVTIIEPNEDDIVSVSSLEYPEYKDMKCQNLSVNSDKITGEVYNPNDYKIESAMITVVFRDSNNKIVSSESAFVDDIPANGKIPFDISLASDAKTTDKIEAFAYLW